MSAFNRDSWQFIVGQLGEKAAAAQFKREGRSVIASCEFSGANDNHAPVLEFERHNLTLPDLDVSGRGRRCWFEVKTYDSARENRSHGIFVHGIPVRLYDHYVNVERETGSEVYLVIVEVLTGEMLVSDRPLSRLTKYECQCRGGCRSVDLARHAPPSSGIRDAQWYFNRDDFEIRCKLDDKTIVGLRETRAQLRDGHAMRRHGSKREAPPPPKPRRGFDVVEGPRVCDCCGKSPRFMIEMEPGRDNTSWWLCFGCWRHGSPSTGTAGRVS